MQIEWGKAIIVLPRPCARHFSDCREIEKNKIISINIICCSLDHIYFNFYSLLKIIIDSCCGSTSLIAVRFNNLGSNFGIDFLKLGVSLLNLG